MKPEADADAPETITESEARDEVAPATPQPATKLVCGRLVPADEA
ncbi:MAG: hypothetical protein K0Q54_2100 [Methylobacterium brachiatum]|nr:hypothetical protein [Methylobacterium brachiatum]